MESCSCFTFSYEIVRFVWRIQNKSIILSQNQERKVFMATLSVNNIWGFLQSLSLSASNEQWLADKLHASAVAKEKNEKNMKAAALEQIFGAWEDNADTERMVSAIKEGRKSDYIREFVSFDN